MEKKNLNEILTLRAFMTLYYDNDKTCQEALKDLSNDTYISSMGWKRVFREEYGEGIYSPHENIVALYDVDDVPQYHEYTIYNYDANEWVDLSTILNQ